jgi:hyperosmotically inducible periplasmic protein
MSHRFVILSAAILAVVPPSLRASELDDLIRSSAGRSFVFQTYLKDGPIEIESKSGRVTLRGTVAEAPHKSLAVYAVESLPGVTHIHNELEVAGGSPAEHSDAWLGSQVSTTLRLHRQVSQCEALVQVKEGMALLRGEVGSQAQLKLVLDHVMNVPGINGVKSEMTVAESSAEPVDKIHDKIDDVSVNALVKWCLLSHRGTRTLNTKVETKNGIVTLRGLATTTDHSVRAATLIADVPGVVGVNNLITVVPVEPNTIPRLLPPKNVRIVVN